MHRPLINIRNTRRDPFIFMYIASVYPNIAIEEVSLHWLMGVLIRRNLEELSKILMCPKSVTVYFPSRKFRLSELPMMLPSLSLEEHPSFADVFLMSSEFRRTIVNATGTSSAEVYALNQINLQSKTPQ
jgi:hypothetical protein